MKPELNSPYSAKEPMLGYLFQCRFALYQSLVYLRDNPVFNVYIENRDDIEFKSENTFDDLYQMKHHVKSGANLSDASTDIWKTIKIWAEGLLNGSILWDSKFYLITTSQVAIESAAYFLNINENRNVDKAIEILNQVSFVSKNVGIIQSFESYNKLSFQQKIDLFTSVYIIDSTPNIKNIESEIQKLLYYAVEFKHLEQFIQRLEGWWYKRIINHLIDASVSPILSVELDAERNKIREQFKIDNLPIDDEVFKATIDCSGYANRCFVQQLRLIEIGEQRIIQAIKNYYRAYQQRSIWIRKDLAFIGELDRYEDRLTEEWEVIYYQAKDKLGASASDDAMKIAAKEIYSWVETNIHFCIRPMVTEPFVTRGTYQILSDNKKVGWHPDFFSKLKELLEQNLV